MRLHEEVLPYATTTLTSAYAIEVEHVKKVYANPAAREVFTDVSVRVKRGEFVTIFGPIGCGKTTLTNLISGLDRPTSGSVRIQGVETTNLAEDASASIRVRNIGLVSQVQNLLDELTVFENVELPLIFLGVDKKSRISRVSQLLDRMGISSDADRKARELSVGEKQMVTIGRALAPDPPIMLMDEPTESLDPLIAEVILGLLRGDNLTKGKTIFVATHDKKVMNLANRALRVQKKMHVS